MIAGWFFLKSSGSAGEVVSRNGLHWHSNLSIKILGETQDIPAGIGLEKLPHQPLHTHDRDNIIHMEYAGLVKNTDLRIGNFFNIWGKTFNQNCIFEKCSGPEGQLRMLVNGKENLEFENYMMRDKDVIEIIYEAPSGKAVESQEITIAGTEFALSPSLINVRVGPVKITFKNEGNIGHNFVIEGLGVATKILEKGQSETIEFVATSAGSYQFFCSMSGHRTAGMEGVLVVTKTE